MPENLTGEKKDDRLGGKGKRGKMKCRGEAFQCPKGQSRKTP